MKVTIYCGVPGSGKTTRARAKHPRATHLSADDVHYDDNGVYNFDASRLAEGHQSCLRRLIKCVSDPWGRPDVVVHNTNTTVAELAPYVAVAQAFGCEVEIVTLLCDPEVAAARNVHGVPTERIHAMDAALRAREIPPWWPHRIEEA